MNELDLSIQYPRPMFPLTNSMMLGFAKYWESYAKVGISTLARVENPAPILSDLPRKLKLRDCPQYACEFFNSKMSKTFDPID